LIKNEGGATKDSGKSNANNKEWLYKISLAKMTGSKCCTVVRDCQLRPFDYLMDSKSEQEEEKTEATTDKDSNQLMATVLAPLCYSHNGRWGGVSGVFDINE